VFVSTHPGKEMFRLFVGHGSSVGHHLVQFVRVVEHYAGKSIHTNKFKPWTLNAYVALPEKHLAENFERHLKSGSGRAFVNRHLLIKNGRNP
jgi:hypothetical protein